MQVPRFEHSAPSFVPSFVATLIDGVPPSLLSEEMTSILGRFPVVAAVNVTLVVTAEAAQRAAPVSYVTVTSPDPIDDSAWFGGQYFVCVGQRNRAVLGGRISNEQLRCVVR